MAIRVTEAQVKTIYTYANNMDTDEIEAAITTANVLVDDQLLGKEGLSATLLTEIEKYLSAHFCVINREFGGFAKRRIDDAEDWYQPLEGDGLEASRYGRQAILLDPSRTLAGIGKKRASFRIFPTYASAKLSSE